MFCFILLGKQGAPGYEGWPGPKGIQSKAGASGPFGGKGFPGSPGPSGRKVTAQVRVLGNSELHRGDIQNLIRDVLLEEKEMQASSLDICAFSQSTW
ncbi:scavenger receptor class A member 5-like isoform X3 [Carassius auratus]|uniref:Scavenger receptor class A member 5-like isoform X3 n=1 Tax=Carassius auratus TaxID=7957 RepID=A0A6P6N928_CARAU|nr:scavenger receptor class A member 5-like isoform X3 [Carassius auratus]